jgi:tetratricopeptide (TPR) repeat protein
MKRLNFVGIFVLCFANLALLPLEAQTVQFPTLAPDAKALEFARRRDYGWQDIGEIGLWASSVGTAGASGAADQAERIRNAVAEMLALPDLPADAKERGEFVLTFIHQRFLKGYVEHQTRLDELFRTGRYNCVSSAVLYAVFASAAGLDVRGVMTKDHAFITVNTGTDLIDVETTNPIGFDPGNRREFHDGFGRLTGFAYVPARNYRDRTAISQLELVSLILSNRISELEMQNRYTEAVPLAINRAALLKDRRDPVSSPFFSDPQRDLTDRLLNYGASLMKSGREDVALQWASLASREYPDDGRWQEFTFAAMNNILVKLLRGQRIADARHSLEAHAMLLSPDNLSKLDTLVADAELVQLSSGIKTPEDALAALLAVEDARGRGTLTEARARELRDFIILKEGQRMSTAGDHRGAMAYTEAAMAKYGKDRQLEEAVRVYRSNRLAELHNAFAGIFNGGDYEGANRFIRSALEEFPGDRNLTQDLNLAERALKNR